MDFFWLMEPVFLQVNIIVSESLAFGKHWLGPLVKIVRATFRLQGGVGVQLRMAGTGSRIEFPYMAIWCAAAGSVFVAP